jgi:GTP-binding protein
LDNLPKDEERTLKINYIIQAKVRPPHFIIFVNNKLIFKNNYMRFLMKNIAEEFQLDGLPLRHTLRSTNNK